MSAIENDKNEKFKRQLTIRYMIALSLIALILMTSFFIIQRQIATNQKDAYLVNISGMQRMLSQRIALFSREIYHETSPENADKIYQKMLAAVETMQSNHRQLTSGNLNDDDGDIYEHQLSPDLFDLYFKENGINDNLVRYIELANRFLDTYKSGGLDAVQSSDIMSQLTMIARNGFLNKLNNVVHQYETEAEQKISRFKNIEVFVLGFGLLALLAEILFIFRPMIALISRNFNSLEQSNHELTEFSYRISHDLRAPVVSSIGLINLTKNAIEKSQTDVAIKSVDHIKTSLLKLENLIDDIMLMMRHKLLEIPYETVDINELVNDTIDKFRALPNFDKIDIRKTIIIAHPLYIQRVYLQQILENLISNAVKYYAPEKDQPFIHISIFLSHNDIEVAIEDNGIGIPEGQDDKLFEMFQRFHPKKSFGSGLGLYLVRQNVISLGGDIYYHRMPDGTKFKVIFPNPKIR